MKKFTDVVGLKLMGIQEGQERGIVQDILVDPKARKVTHVILKSDTGYDFYAVFITDILGIGADFLVTSTITNAAKVDESLNLNINGFSLVGATAVSSSGDIKGMIIDFDFDPISGKIGSVLLDNGIEYEMKKAATLVGKMVFVNQDEIENDHSETEETANAKENVEAKDNAEALPEGERTIDSDTWQFLLGKAVTDDVISDDGLFCIQRDTVLNPAILNEAEARGMMLMLTLNV